MRVSRKVMNRFFLATSLLTGWFLTGSAIAQDYVLDPNWPQPLPDGIEWGQVPNVTIDQEGFIYAFHRAEPPVLKFSPSGELVDTFGSEWVSTPHGFRAAPDGTLWATDYNRQTGHTVTQRSEARRGGTTGGAPGWRWHDKKRRETDAHVRVR